LEKLLIIIIIIIIIIILDIPLCCTRYKIGINYHQLK